MAHVLVLVEGRELWTDLFLNDLLKRRYQYKMNDGRYGMIQPNPREIRLFDISVPEDAVPKLLEDLGCAENSSPLRGKVLLAAEAMRVAAGLYSIGDMDPPKGRIGGFKNWVKEKIGLRKKPIFDFSNPEGIRPNIRKQWLNIIPIGWAKDKKIGNKGDAVLPKDGELI